MVKKTKVALITGGAKRIGKSIAVHLAARGFQIALHYHRSKADAENAAQEICKRKGVCKIFSADLADTKETQDLIPKVLKEFSRVDLVINNASIFERSPMKTSGFDVLERHFKINFFAPYILTVQFASRCRKGNVINILDTNVAKNKVTHTAYLLSKKTLAEMTKLAAIEFAPHIRVNAVAPGLILPPAGKSIDYLNQRAQSIPLKKKGNPTHIARAVEYLLGNDFVTGEILSVDGGEHLL